MLQFESFVDAVAALPALPAAQRALAASDLRYIADVVLARLQRAAIAEATGALPAADLAEHLGLSEADIAAAVARHTALEAARLDGPKQ